MIVYFLGITEIQRDGLNNAANNTLSEFHHKFFKLEKLNDNIVPDGIFGYQLYLAGYSVTNNSYAVVSSTPAIKLFTADNKIFCSAEYTQSILSTGLLTDKIVEVHFERPDDYEKGRNHFGFDWLRKEYVEKKKLCIQANIGVYDQSGNLIRTDHYYNDEAREELKKEYTPFTLNGNFYYVPWLTMYQHHQNTVNYIGDVNKRSVKLRIKLENAGLLKKNDKIYFHLPNGIEVGLDSDTPGSNLVTIQEPRKLNKRHITIQCTTPSGDHRSIEVRDGTDIETSKLLGKLNISENNQLTNLEEARFVHLFFEGDISKDNIDFDFHIDNNLHNLLNIRISSIDAEGNPQTTNYNNNVLNHNEWNNWIAKTHKITKSYLHQCLVDYNPDYEITNTNSIGEITAINIHSKVKIQFVSPHNHRLFRMDPGNNNWVEILDNGSNNLTDTLDLFEQAILNLRYDYEPLRKDNKVPSIIFDTDTITGRLNYLFGNYYNFLDYQERIVVICFPLIYGTRKRTAQTEPIEKPLYPGGFHIERSKLIFLTGYPNSWMINDYTLAHEIGHRCSLDHTFLDNNSNDNSNKKRFVFKEKRITDNLMDYAEGDLIDESGNIIKQDVKESFWEWQKKIITYWFNNELPLE